MVHKQIAQSSKLLRTHNYHQFQYVSSFHKSRATQTGFVNMQTSKPLFLKLRSLVACLWNQ